MSDKSKGYYSKFLDLNKGSGEVKPQGMTWTEQKRAFVNKKRELERDIGDIPAVVNPERRLNCSKDLALFLKTYLRNSFYLPWSNDHLKIIKKTETAIFHGGLFALAMPRGSGKTTVVEGSVLFAALYGYRKYIVPISANAASAESILSSIKVELESNEMISEDFPEVSYPVMALKGVALKAKAQTVNGERTHIEWTKTKIILPAIPGSASSEVIIHTKGLMGHLRGLKYKTTNGDVIRPDFFFADDPQDDEVAASPSQCDKREALINGAVLGLAGHKKKIAGIMPCTIINRDDLAARMLNQIKNPDWQGEICKLIYKWPDAQETLWKEYEEIRKVSILEGNRGIEATEFYKQNKEEMDRGSIVGWEHRKYDHELSALQHAENLLLERGESAFYAEFQNDPVAKIVSLYELNVEMVCSRVNHYPRFQVPPETHFLTVGIDINVNERGINYVVNAVCNDMTSYVVDYGRYPEVGHVWKSTDGNGISESQAIHAAISNVCDLIINRKEYIRNGDKKRIDGILIDCGYMTGSVIGGCKHVSQTMGIPTMPSRGRGGKSYKQTKLVGKAGENFHKTEWAKYKSNVIVHNTDILKMQVQKAFLLKPSAPGSISLYGKDQGQHKHYAENICCEVLSEFVRGDINDYYAWSYRPGYVNDLLDAQIIATVAAGLCGASITGGEASWRSKPKPPPKKAKGKASYG